MPTKTLIAVKDGVWKAFPIKEGIREKLAAAGYEIKKEAAIPSLAALERMSDDGVCKALDGCHVEPDGTCRHGAPSWLLYLGFI